MLAGRARFGRFAGAISSVAVRVLVRFHALDGMEEPGIHAGVVVE